MINQLRMVVETYQEEFQNRLNDMYKKQNLEDKIKTAGAKLGSSVSKNTFVVIVKNLEEDTTKAIDAKKLEIPLITVEEFNKKYF